MFNTPNQPQTFNAQEIAALANLRGLQGDGLAEQIVASKNRRFAAYVADFSNSIAAGGTATVVVQIASDSDFVVEDIRGDFRCAVAVATALAGTPLPREALYTGASNTLPGLNLIGLQFSLQQLNWMSDFVPANLVLGDARSPGYFLTLPRISSADRLTISVQNNTNEAGTSAAVKGKVLLSGYHLSQNPISRS